MTTSTAPAAPPRARPAQSRRRPATGAPPATTPAGRAEAWLERPLLQVATAIPAAGLVALVSAGQLWVNWRGQGFDVDLSRLLVAEGVEWGLWAAVVPILVAVDARFEDGRRRKAILAHLTVAVAWFLVLNLALAAMTRIVDPAATASLASLYLDRAVMRLPSSLGVYAFLAAGLWLVKSTVRQERLRRGLVEAQLRSLRAQIRPHFLFNTLHTAASLVRADERQAAVRTLVGLGELLRRSLRHTEEDEVELREEIAFIETYLDIQRARFGDRLGAAIDVEPGLDTALVPFLLLQPLVENAIRHGVDLDTETGRVDVRVRRRGPRLGVIVADSGRAAPAAEGGLGLGLDNVRERLVALYGPDQHLRIEGGPDGTRVDVEIPFRRAGDA